MDQQKSGSLKLGQKKTRMFFSLIYFFAFSGKSEYEMIPEKIVFHGFAQNLRVFMAHENWKINGFLMDFLMFMSCFFQGDHR